VDSQKGMIVQLGDLGMGLTTPRREKQACYENSQEASDLDGFLE
jgi:hypothetical protein